MSSSSCCGTVLPSDARFCPKCGRAVMNCQSCGHKLEPDARFCQHCGKPCQSETKFPPEHEVLARAEVIAAKDRLLATAQRRERDEEEQRRRAAEIGPGTWEQTQVDGVAGGMFGGVALNVTWKFDADGSMNGQSAIALAGVQTQVDVNGTWNYDYRERVLSLNGSGVMQCNAGFPMAAVPFGRWNRRFRITGGSKGNWYAVAEDDGSTHRFIKTG